MDKHINISPHENNTNGIILIIPKIIHHRRGIAIDRKKSCASCEKDYSKKNWVSNRRWCRQCKIYLCKDCAEEGKCPKCQGKAKGMLMGAFTWLALFSFIFTMSFAAVLIPFLLELPQVNMETTDI
ncbi:MAG: hypothetical protein JSW28_07990, partial [Thermoplasmata archaeon]